MVMYRDMRGYVEDGWLCTLTTIEFSGATHGTNAEQVQSGTGSERHRFQAGGEHTWSNNTRVQYTSGTPVQMLSCCQGRLRTAVHVIKILQVLWSGVLMIQGM